MYLSWSKDNEIAVAVFALIGAIVGGAGLFAVSVITNGFVLSVLWGWFVSGYFEIKSLTIPEAFGLSLIIKFLTFQSNLKTEERSVWANLAFVFLLPLCVLFTGWMTHLFM